MIFPPSADFKAKDFLNDKFVCVKDPDANYPRERTSGVVREMHKISSRISQVRKREGK